MKKEHFSLVMIFISISLLTACNSSFLDLDFTSLTDDYQINNLAQKHIEPSNWEEQVEYAMQSNAFKQIGGKNSVDLIDFIICDTIKSEKQKAQLIRAIFSDEATIAMPIENGVLVNQIGEIKDNIDNYIGVSKVDYDLFAEYKAIADSLIHCGMYIAEATWNYNGKNITSISVISDKTNLIVYDNIGTVCPIGSANSYQQQALSIPRNSCITFTEGGGNNKVIITDMSDSEHNIYGGLLWRYRIFSISEFNSSNTLIRANNIPESEGKLGWRCSAKMHTIAGDINVSNYHKFAYAYAHGFGISIGISWNGTSFDISTNGGSSASGEITHNPL